MLLSLLSKRTLNADSRDAYGFTVRPQYLDTFKEFDSIYKKEEEERSTKWRSFLEQQEELVRLNSSIKKPDDAEVTEENTNHVLESTQKEGDVLSDKKPTEDNSNNNTNNNQTENVPEKVVSEAAKPAKKHALQNWTDVRTSLNTMEDMMCHRVNNPQKHVQEEGVGPSTEELTTDDEKPNPVFPWKELESLVRGGVPRELRGEVWQAFVGVKARRVERYYQNLLEVGDAGNKQLHDQIKSNPKRLGEKGEKAAVPEKCKKQIEKDLPRTFPGHPALNEEGRDSLRRLLLAYARHNPDVGYCQAMNFFAAMLLLMMPEENAFWTLVGMIDDYFDGYFTTDMIESQVDQLVFEDLMRERYPKLVNHFNMLGVEMGWICGPWFLSIFVNMIPWESVLRVWDVILFEGNRAMLLRTALALMELYGPDLCTTRDAGDAITSMQSLVSSTFDSSNLVVTACISFSYVTEDTLQQLREKHRPDVIAAVEERKRGDAIRKDPKGLATKLYSFKHEPKPLVRQPSMKQGLTNDNTNLNTAPKPDDSLNIAAMTTEVDSLPDFQDQVVWLKAQLCSMLDDKRSATIRAEELEIALMEMAKEDNRRELTAKIEHMEREVNELHQLLADKKEQEKKMLEVLMRVEQEQKVAEDARKSAEQDAAAQRYLVNVLERKYEEAVYTLAQMEKRVVMAESTLEATMQYNSGQVKAVQPTGLIRPESNTAGRRPGILSFGLGWRDRNKTKTTGESKSSNEVSDAKAASETNGYQEPEK
ncbi:unnamed protein product [Lactuca saligna]|uniref:Rab-GAP TBC domain-containing protein n=1 Tax=Lactuca saligna TaxID=75948 RepID=A0AA35VUC3_LACSI|nr:unnamed protein product [Lactuca saligna]